MGHMTEPFSILKTQYRKWFRANTGVEARTDIMNTGLWLSSLAATDSCSSLAPRFEDQVEGGFARAPEVREPRFAKHLGQACLACLRTEREGAAFGYRVRGAHQRRASIEELPDQPKVVFDSVVGEWLDQQNRAAGGKMLGGVPRCGNRVAHVV
jgi:hypothetical protein